MGLGVQFLLEVNSTLAQVWVIVFYGRMLRKMQRRNILLKE
jgi:hypothetical protein